MPGSGSSSNRPASGWGGHIVSTDVFHPGFFLAIDQPEEGPVTDYAHVEDFATGEVWRSGGRRAASSPGVFVSEPNNTIVCTTTGPAGKVSLSLTMRKPGNNLIDSRVTHANGWITCHNVYVKGKGGYDAAVRVVADGGANGATATRFRSPARAPSRCWSASSPSARRCPAVRLGRPTRRTPTSPAAIARPSAGRCRSPPPTTSRSGWTN